MTYIFRFFWATHLGGKIIVLRCFLPISELHLMSPFFFLTTLCNLVIWTFNELTSFTTCVKNGILHVELHHTYFPCFWVTEKIERRSCLGGYFWHRWLWKLLEWWWRFVTFIITHAECVILAAQMCGRAWNDMSNFLFFIAQ